MDSESLKSERSSRSHKSKHSGTRSRNHFRNKTSINNLKNMAPFQTTINLINNNNDDDENERENNGQEVIEVQILPQDENWGGETHITGNTSEQSISMENINWPTKEEGEHYSIQKYCENSFLLLMCSISFLSPIGMALLPKLGFFPSTFNNEELNKLTRIQLLDCNAECKGIRIIELITILLMSLNIL